MLEKILVAVLLVHTIGCASSSTLDVEERKYVPPTNWADYRSSVVAALMAQGYHAEQAHSQVDALMKRCKDDAIASSVWQCVKYGNPYK